MYGTSKSLHVSSKPFLLRLLSETPPVYHVPGTPISVKRNRQPVHRIRFLSSTVLNPPSWPAQLSPCTEYIIDQNPKQDWGQRTSLWNPFLEARGLRRISSSTTVVVLFVYSTLRSRICNFFPFVYLPSCNSCFHNIFRHTTVLCHTSRLLLFWKKKNGVSATSLASLEYYPRCTVYT